MTRRIRQFSICTFLFSAALSGAAAHASDPVEIAEPINDQVVACDYAPNKLAPGELDVVACFFLAKPPVGRWVVDSIETGAPEVRAGVIRVEYLDTFVVAYFAIENLGDEPVLALVRGTVSKIHHVR